MREPTSPPIGAKTKMPLFARVTRVRGARCGVSAAGGIRGEPGGRGHDRPADGVAAFGRGNERAGEHPVVEPVAGVRVVITYDLETGEGTDAGADEDVAGPVPIVVHPRDAGERGTGVENGPDDPARLRPPARGLARHGGRGGEGRRRVAGGERPEPVAAAEPAE